MSTALASPVQKFEPTTGPGIGYVGLAVCALVVGVVVTSEQHVTGVQVALGAVLLPEEPRAVERERACSDGRRAKPLLPVRRLGRRCYRR